MALNDQHAANRIKHNRWQLVEEVIDELHQEFLLKNIQPDGEQLAQNLGKMCQMIVVGAVNPDFTVAVDTLTDLAGQYPYLPHPFFFRAFSFSACGE